MRSATTCPARATTVAETCGAGSTVTGATTTERAGTCRPCNGPGVWRTPPSSTKAMSTVAGAGYGLNNTIFSDASSVVAPAANCHRSDADVAHGPTSDPSGPRTRCSTATSPPRNSTTADAYAAWTRSVSATRTWPRGGTSCSIVLDAPLLGIAVTVPLVGRSVGL